MLLAAAAAAAAMAGKPTTTAAASLEPPDADSDAEADAGPDTGVGEIKAEMAATGESKRALCGYCVGVLDMGDSTVRTSRRTRPNVSASEP